MKAAAIIPARGGSKRVPDKNVQRVGVQTLVDRAVSAANGAGCETWVSTDDAAIVASALGTSPIRMPHAAVRAVVEQSLSMFSVGKLHPCRIGIHSRPPALASDHAQIEAAVSHWYTRLDEKPDVIVILQPTSPFRTARHVKEALRLLDVTGADSVIGVTASHDSHFAGRLKPREVGNGLCAGEPWFEWQPHAPMGHDRPRTQDLPPRGTDNGSLYVTRRKAWETSELRTSGVTVALPMSRIEGWDIDTIEDLEAARAMAEGMGL